MNSNMRKILPQVAENLGLKSDGTTKVLFGNYQGYEVFMLPQEETAFFQMAFAVTKDGELPTNDFAQAVVKNSEALHSYRLHGQQIVFLTKTKLSIPKAVAKIEQAANDIVTALQENNYISCCENCGAMDDLAHYIVGGIPMTLCPNCFQERSAASHAQVEVQKQIKEKIPSGLMGALIGSLIGVAAIVFFGQMGYVAALSGIILAFCTLKGYELLAGRLSNKGAILSSVVMLVMVYVGTRLDWSFSAADAYNELSVFSAFRLMPTLLKEGYMIASEFHKNLGVCYLFTVLGAFPTIVSIMAKSNRSRDSYKMAERN